MAGAAGLPSADGSSRSLEIERKYDVEDATPLPDWTGIPGVVAVGRPELRALDARYLDTADQQLAHARVAVRRRTGGPDAGWHIKISAPDGKHEWGWPLDGDPDAASDDDLTAVPVPDAVVAALAEWAAPPFIPLARIRNARVAYALRDANGGLVAEFVDDRVNARDERGGGESSWREWELELGPAAPSDPVDRAELFAVADTLVLAAGGRIAASGSKLARALGA